MGRRWKGLTIAPCSVASGEKLMVEIVSEYCTMIVRSRVQESLGNDVGQRL